MLHVIGDEGNNQIEIDQDARALRIVCDGERAEFADLRAVAVETAAGDDAVKYNPYITVDYIEVITGTDNDTVVTTVQPPLEESAETVMVPRTAIDLGPGDDAARLAGVSMAQVILSISAGEGNDEIGVEVFLPAVQSTQNGGDEVDLDLGVGDDVAKVKIDTARALDLDIGGGAGNDVVELLQKVRLPDFQSAVGQKVRVNLSAGDDQAEISVDSLQPVEGKFRAGEGNDVVQIALLLPAIQKVRAAADTMDLDLGAGDDEAKVSVESSRPIAFQLDGSSGNEVIECQFKFFRPPPTELADALDLKFGEGDDTAKISVETAHALDLGIGAGAGNDVVELLQKVRLPDFRSAVGQKVRLDLDAGDDRAEVVVDSVQPVDWKLRAGDGNDDVGMDVQLRRLANPTLPPQRFDKVELDLGLGDDTTKLNINSGDVVGEFNIELRSSNAPQSGKGKNPCYMTITWEPETVRGKVVSGDGDDYLAISGESTDPVNWDVDTREGNDQVVFDLAVPTRAADGTDHVKLNLGAGDDDAKVAIASPRPMDFNLAGSDGNDVVEAEFNFFPTDNKYDPDEKAAVDFDFGAGDDNATVQVESGGPVEFRLDAGAGNDAVTADFGSGEGFIADLDARVNLSDGDDTARLAYAKNNIEGESKMDTKLRALGGAGNDVIEATFKFFRPDPVEGTDELRLSLGTGDDEAKVSVESVRPMDFKFEGSDGNDVIECAFKFFRPDHADVSKKALLNIGLGAGDDDVTVKVDSARPAELRLDAGAGNDAVVTEFGSAGGMIGDLEGRFDLGDGDDTATFAYANGAIEYESKNDTKFFAGAGNDVVKAKFEFAPSDHENDSQSKKVAVELDLGEGDDRGKLDVIGSDAVDALIVGDAGNDAADVTLITGEITALEPDWSVDIRMGDGDDTARFSSVSAGPAEQKVRVAGGAGRDALAVEIIHVVQQPPVPDAPVLRRPRGVLDVQVFGDDDNDTLSLIVEGSLDDVARRKLLVDGGRGLDICDASPGVTVINCEDDPSQFDPLETRGEVIAGILAEWTDDGVPPGDPMGLPRIEFDPNGRLPTYWVFGTELPDVLLLDVNELGTIVVTDVASGTELPILDVSTGLFCGEGGVCPTPENTEQIIALLGGGDDKLLVDGTALAGLNVLVEGEAGNDTLALFTPMPPREPEGPYPVPLSVQYVAGPEDGDVFHLVTTDAAEQIPIAGGPLPDGNAAHVEVIDVASQQTTAKVELLTYNELLVDALGGDDVVQFVFADGSVRGVHVGIDMGTGNDLVEAAFSDLSFDGPHSVTIDGNTGNDTLKLAYTQVAINAPDHRDILIGGTGQDVLLIVYDDMLVSAEPVDGPIWEDWRILSGPGDDVAAVVHRDVVLNAPVVANLQGEAGNDVIINTFEDGAVHAAHKIAVGTGTGDDLAFFFETGVAETAANHLTLATGAGDDGVVLLGGEKVSLDALPELELAGAFLAKSVGRVQSIFEQLGIGLGTGDGQFDNTDAAEKVIALDAGDGDDTTVVAMLDAAAQKVRLGLELGAGDDVSESELIFKPAELHLGLKLDAGTGDDVAKVRAIHKIGDVTLKRGLFSADMVLGTGNDKLTTEVIDFDEVSHKLSAGSGDDEAQGYFNGRLLSARDLTREQTYEGENSLGSGDDKLTVEARDFDGVAQKVRAGTGNDEVKGVYNHSGFVALLPYIEQDNLGPGNDKLSIEAVGFDQVSHKLVAGSGDDEAHGYFNGRFLTAEDLRGEQSYFGQTSMGSGVDVVDLTVVVYRHVEIDMSAGSGDDIVKIGSHYKAGDATLKRGVFNADIELGAGNDLSTIETTDYEEVLHKLSTGSGDDTADVKDGTSNTFAIGESSQIHDLGSGNDKLSIEVHGFDRVEQKVRAGSGNDTVKIAGIRHVGDIALKRGIINTDVELGSGDDNAALETIDFDDVSHKLSAGTGDDTTTVQDGTSNTIAFTEKFARCDLGSGNDHHTAVTSGFDDVEVHCDAGTGDDSAAFFFLPEINDEVVGIQQGRVILDADLNEGNDSILVETEFALVPTDYSYFIDTGAGDDAGQIHFGDGQHGRIPASGHSVRVQYRAGSGADNVHIGVHSEQTRQITIVQDLGSGDDISDLTVEADGAVNLVFSGGAGDDVATVEAYHNPQKFQIISAGKDGSFNMGPGNDVLEFSVQPAAGADGSLDPVALDDSAPGLHVAAELALGSGNDQLHFDVLTAVDDTVLDVAIGAGDGDDHVAGSLHFSPELLERLDPPRFTAELAADLGGGSNAFFWDAFSNAEPTASLTEILIGLFVANVGELSLLTLFPIGSLEIAQAIQDNRGGALKSDIAMQIDGLDFSADVRTGASDDTVQMDLHPIEGSQVQLAIDTAAGNDAVRVSVDDDPDNDTEQSADRVSEAISDAAIHFDASVVTGPHDDRVDIEVKHDSGVPAHYDWLVHLDRQLVSPDDTAADDGNDALSFDVFSDVPLFISQAAFFGGGGDDQVVVDFEHGEVRGPVVVGTLWNGDTGPGDDDVDTRIQGPGAHAVHANLGEGDDEYSGIALLEPTAVLDDQIGFYQDRIANEAYLGTARLGPGNDTAVWEIVSRSPTTQVGLAVSGDSGDDDFSADVVFPADPCADVGDFSVDLGTGFDTGKLAVDFAGAVEEPVVPVVPELVELNVKLAGGADDDILAVVLAGVLPETTGSVAVLGAGGNDVLTLVTDAAPPNLALLIDGGEGVDTCTASPGVEVINCEDAPQDPATHATHDAALTLLMAEGNTADAPTTPDELLIEMDGEITLSLDDLFADLDLLLQS